MVIPDEFDNLFGMARNTLLLVLMPVFPLFSPDEVERLERQLESEEAKYRRLEEDHNRSKQEKSHLSATEDDLRKREKSYKTRIDELEREMETKSDLVCLISLCVCVDLILLILPQTRQMVTIHNIGKFLMEKDFAGLVFILKEIEFGVVKSNWRPFFRLKK